MGIIEEWGLRKKAEEKRNAEVSPPENLNVFDKLLILHGGDEEKTMAYMRGELRRAKRRYDAENGGPSVGAQILREAAASSEDDVERVLFVKREIDDIPEPERSNIWQELNDHRETFSEKAQTEISFLAASCEAGRALLVKRAEEMEKRFPRSK